MVTAVRLGVPKGPGLGWARLAVFAWMAARHRGVPLLAPDPGPDPRRLEELGWLGLDFDEGPPPPGEALQVCEAGEAVEGPVLRLGPLRGESRSLEAYRLEGYIPEGLLAYLGELGWRDPESHAYLTRPELLLEFREEDLSPEPVDFDSERLEEVHAQFLDELTPAELVERSLPFWRAQGLLEGEVDEQQQRDLEALALLYGMELRRLADFPRKASFYLRDPEGRWRHAGLAPLAAALEGLDPWDSVVLEQVVLALDPDTYAAAERAVTGTVGTPGLAEVMALVGKESALRRLRR